MTIEEIKGELKARGWTYAVLAEKLAMKEGSLGHILRGTVPLTDTLSRHIELLFERSRTAVFVYSVDLPEATCRLWVPAWDELTEEERVTAIKAVVLETMDKLKALGNQVLSPEDQAALAAIARR